MKAHATVVFEGGLTDLTVEEAELIRDAVKLVSILTPDEAEEAEISKEQVKLAEKMYPELRVKFSEAHWRG